MLSYHVQVICTPNIPIKTLWWLTWLMKRVFLINLASNSLAKSADGDSIRGVKILLFECRIVVFVWVLASSEVAFSENLVLQIRLSENLWAATRDISFQIFLHLFLFNPSFSSSDILPLHHNSHFSFFPFFYCFCIRLTWIGPFRHMSVLTVWSFCLRIAVSRVSYDKRFFMTILGRTRVIGMKKFKMIINLISLVRQVNRNHSCVY